MSVIVSKTNLLNELLNNLVKEIKDLIAVLIVDSNGLIMAQQSNKGFKEEIFEVIISIVEENLEKMKKYAEISLGSGTIHMNEYQLFYVEMGINNQGLFVMVTDPYSNLNDFIPYSYLVAEKASNILNNIETSIELPKINGNGNIIFDDHSSSFSKPNKIVIIGSDSVGKTSLVDMYLKGKTGNNYIPTIGLSVNKRSFEITKNMSIDFQIFDMGGLKSFKKVRKYYYQDAKVVIILFDYSKLTTLENINEWIEEARNFIKTPKTNYYLVGNKIDLINDRESIQSSALDLSYRNNFSYYETSAFTGEGVDELFTSCISNLL
jgi:small GTP-binding protein